VALGRALVREDRGPCVLGTVEAGTPESPQDWFETTTRAKPP